MARMGRPPRVEGERRRSTGLSLGDSEVEALRELSEILDEPQGVIVGRLIMAALKREKKRSKT